MKIYSLKNQFGTIDPQMPEPSVDPNEDYS